MAKLTLSVDAEVVRRAKRAARTRGTSVSHLVEEYLHLLASPPRVPDEELPPVVRKLHGRLKGVKIGDYRGAYRSYVEKKYR